MQRFWNRWAPYWHICTALLFAAFVSVTWINDVSGHSARIGKLEKDMNAINEMRFNLKNIAERLGVRYIEDTGRNK